MNRSYDSPSMAPTRLAFHLSRIVADAGVLLVLGAMSLPFVTADGFEQRALAGDALPVLLLVAPIFLMTLLPDQSTPLPRPLTWVALFLAPAALALAVIKYFDAATLADSLPGSVGIGPKVLVMGAFIVLGGVVLGLIPGPARSPGVDATLAGVAPEPAAARVAAPARSARPPRSPASEPAPGRRAAPAAVPAPSTPTRQFPRWRRPGSAAAPASPAPRSPSPSPAPTRRPAADRPAPRPAPADPDAEPTLPGQRPVQGWWPDDLEDLLS